MQRAPTRFAYYNSFLPRGTRGTVMPTRMAVLSGSVEMVLDQAVSENFSAAVYARILNLQFNFKLICMNTLYSHIRFIVDYIPPWSQYKPKKRYAPIPTHICNSLCACACVCICARKNDEVFYYSANFFVPSRLVEV